MKKITKKLISLVICLSIIFSIQSVFADSTLDKMIAKKPGSPSIAIVVDQPISGSYYCTDKNGRVSHTFFKIR